MREARDKMPHYGDVYIDLEDIEQVKARVRAIIAHRIHPGRCFHTPGCVAMHAEPFDGDEYGLEVHAINYAELIQDRQITFNEVREDVQETLVREVGA